MSVNEKLTAIADAIRDKTGKTDPLTLDDMAQSIPDVYAKGKQEQNDKFWDEFTQYGERTNYQTAFAHWGAEYIRPARKIIPKSVSGASQLFAHAKSLKKIEAEYFDLSEKQKGGTNYQEGHYYTFYQCASLEEIEDIGMQAENYYHSTFSVGMAGKLHTIAKIRVHENSQFSNTFSNDGALKNVTFEGLIGQNISFAWSPLSVESMKNIISHLMNYSGTENEGKYKLTFSSGCWDALEASGTAPDGNSWKDYVFSLGWLT